MSRSRAEHTVSSAVSTRNRRIQDIEPIFRRFNHVTAAVETPRRQYSSSWGGVWCTLCAAGESIKFLFWRWVTQRGRLLFIWCACRRIFRGAMSIVLSNFQKLERTSSRSKCAKLVSEMEPKYVEKISKMTFFQHFFLFGQNGGRG